MSKKPPLTMTHEEEVLMQILPRDRGGNILGRAPKRTPVSILRDKQDARIKAQVFQMAKFDIALQKTGSSKPLSVINEVGFNVNIQDANGNTPLHMAANYGSIIAIDALVAKGVKLEEPDNSGRTAMHWAAVKGGADAVQALLKQGAKIDAKDKTGSTPLFLAALAGNEGSVLALIKAGASTDLDIKEIPEGKSRAMIAAKQQVLALTAAERKALEQPLRIGKEEAIKLAGKGTSRNLLAEKSSSQGRG